MPLIMRSVALVVIVVIAMMIAVVIMIAVVTVPMAVMPAEIDHDCRFTVAVAVPPMATDLDDTAVAFTPAPGTAFAGTAKTTPRASADSIMEDTPAASVRQESCPGGKRIR